MSKTKSAWSDNNKFAGFTLIEIAIALFILAVFLLPLTQHFVRTRRVSLAARDAVIVNSFQTSCVGELRMLDYNDLLSESGATFSSILKKYCGGKVVNNLNIATRVNISRCAEVKMLMIDVKSEFRFPGSADEVVRKVGMRGYVFPKP
ncbi:MAG TPA: hypothetical protein DCG57_07010 [Candidatus Riflebacteria bacterium]|nr:hypothetical protein [Candidatus Riflebacteria bacterium]